MPVRKKGKLPYDVVSHQVLFQNMVLRSRDAYRCNIKKGWNVLVHDDLLATGGTATASAELIKKLGGIVCGFTFVIELAFLNGREMLNEYTDNTISLVKC